MGKYGPEKTPDWDLFYAVLLRFLTKNSPLLARQNIIQDIIYFDHFFQAFIETLN